MSKSIAWRTLALALLLALCPVAAGDARAQKAEITPAEERNSPTGGNVPGNVLGASSDAEMWRAVRHGIQGTVSIPDKQAGTLVQAQGEQWRNVRNGPLITYGGWLLLGMLALLALFFALRGRIRIAAGRSGRTVTRFNLVERTSHWLLAGSFIVLAVSGLNMLYGKYVLPGLIGKPAFAAITLWLKYAHHYVAFAFMVGLALVFVMWVIHNFPNRHDIVWLLKGGGMFSRHGHPPAKKFNAGQKIVFWLVILGGLSLSLSGWMLMFPFTTSYFAETFAIINAILQTDLPTALTPLQEQQLATTWHAVVAYVLIALIFGHIYIGTVGMEGAIDAMYSGEVDANWAKAHHPQWAADEAGEGDAKPAAQPAE